MTCSLDSPPLILPLLFPIFPFPRSVFLYLPILLPKALGFFLGYPTRYHPSTHLTSHEVDTPVLQLYDETLHSAPRRAGLGREAPREPGMCGREGGELHLPGGSPSRRAGRERGGRDSGNLSAWRNSE